MNVEVRDALPDLMHGRLSDLDKVTMSAHVETCADCREELRLLQEIRSSAPFAPRIDVARIVSALPAPMPSAADQAGLSAPARGRRSPSIILRWAAVAAVVVTGTVTFANARRQAPARAVGSAVVPQVVPRSEPKASTSGADVALPSSVAESVVASRTATRIAPALSLTGGVQDLSDDQLQALVEGLDNIEALPAIEPEPMTITVDNKDGLQ